MGPELFEALVDARGVQEPGAQASGGQEAEQEPDGFEGARLVVVPERLDLEVGEKARLEVRVVGADGGGIEGVRVLFLSRGRERVSVDSEGNVEALAPGDVVVVCRTLRRNGRRLEIEVPVKVAAPAIASVAFVDLPETLYAGTTLQLKTVAVDVEGAEREGEAKFTSSLSAVAEVDPFGNLVTHRPGTFVLLADVEGTRASRTMVVRPNPIARIDLLVDGDDVRTGDVVRMHAAAKDAAGRAVTDVPILFSFVARPDDTLGPAASGQIEPDGRFVAETPGQYTIVATSGSATARRTIRARERGIRRELEVLGHGPVFETHTSDLWVWEGVDGRDYAVTGTWGASGEAHFWDVTDPTNLVRIATVQVDARTVNDVKVSSDGRVCVISREGASDRKNGVVLYDVSNPAEPKLISVHDDDLTGGVHNVFIDGDDVYALSAGRRYDILNISDASRPFRIGSYELDTPGHSIHDVWVVDGLAYSSNWRDGVHIVDVGNGIRGGSTENPTFVSSYAYPTGWNHAAFPFTSAETGRFYVVAGDEAFPYGLFTEDQPTYPRGWLHFIDFTDLENPVEVARFQVPEAGTHNLWIENGICYAAFYNGGVRVLDVTGELLGDLYRQGREIAVFRPTHKDGMIANAPMVWGPQPHKGTIFLSDWNSGLWAVRLGKPDTRPR